MASKSLLRDHSLTKGFSSSELDRLAGMLEEQRFAVGDKLCTEGAMTRGLYFVTEGSLAISGLDQAKAEQHLATLKAPTVLGELEIITGQPAFATGTAETPVVAYLLTHESFDKLVNQGEAIISKLTRKLARLVIQRLVESNARLLKTMYK
jgi:CRP/FNR family transcriptional regulator, cyclic AMP receptor protein